MAEERVIGRYLLQGKLRLESPLLIGCGEKSGTDCPVLKDTEGIPYIPGTTLGGVLRHYFEPLAKTCFPLDQVEKFWGSEKKEKKGEKKDSQVYQSAFFVSDLRPLGKPRVVVRDGIAVDERGNEETQQAGYLDSRFIEFVPEEDE